MYLLANVFFKEDKVRFTTQTIQIDLVPSRLRQLTDATGFAVARVTRVTGYLGAGMLAPGMFSVTFIAFLCSPRS